MAKKCRKFGYRKEIQTLGPAKRVRYCKTYAGKRPKGWCVWKGKAKVSCHKLKRTATRRVRTLRKGCKARVRVKRAA